MDVNILIEKHYRGTNLLLKYETSDDILEVIKDFVVKCLNKYCLHCYYAKED